MPPPARDRIIDTVVGVPLLLVALFLVTVVPAVSSTYYWSERPDVLSLAVYDARGRFEKIRVYRSEFMPLRHTLSKSSERTLMKLVVDDANDRVVGLHMVGADAGEAAEDQQDEGEQTPEPTADREAGVELDFNQLRGFNERIEVLDQQTPGNAPSSRYGCTSTFTAVSLWLMRVSKPCSTRSSSAILPAHSLRSRNSS